MTSLAARLDAIRSRLPPGVTLVAVSKTQPAQAIREAHAAGQRHFGENYAQEWRDKAPQLADLEDLVWHFVGSLQTNKVKLLLPETPPRAAWVHTLDRLALAEELSRRAAARRLTLRVLVEVNLAGEARKAGCPLEDLDALVAAASRLPGLELRGLTCIPPAQDDPRPHFRALRALRDRLALPDLSMGMSADWEAAVEEGATLVRVGTSIFGPRPPRP